MRSLLLLLSLFLLSCTPNEESSCDENCGKLITKYHKRDLKLIEITYVSQCKDTLIDTINLTEEQLSTDNGITYFIETFKLGQKYCKQ